MKFNKIFVKTAVGVVVISSSVSSAFAAGLSTTDFGSLQSDITATIGVAAGIGVALMVVGLGWDVGISLVKKFVKRGAK